MTAVGHKLRFKQRCRVGTVLMECVLVLPLLTLLIFAVVQFSLIWYAQLMTHYAAYNAARAALVYNPAEYSENGVFYDSKGPCWEAAVTTLSWLSSSVDGGSGSVHAMIPNWGMVPNSSHIENQVRIDKRESAEGGAKEPCVKVRLTFDYPLHVPVIGKMISYMLNTSGDEDMWSPTGWTPDPGRYAATEAAAHPVMKSDYIRLHAYCVMPKPWATTCFHRRPAAEGGQ